MTPGLVTKTGTTFTQFVIKPTVIGLTLTIRYTVAGSPAAMHKNGLRLGHEWGRFQERLWRKLTKWVTLSVVNGGA